MQTKQKRRPAPNSAATKTRRRPSQRTRRPGGSASDDIVYTPPKPFSQKRFLLRLITVVAVVLAITLGMSIFFKVDKVMVSGNSKYTPWDVKDASGIQSGDNLLTLSRAQIGGRIRTNLPYVEEVRVGIKLPDTVNIEIKELDVVYAVEASDNSWWLMNAAGKIVDSTSLSSARAHTQILGVQIQVPQIGSNAVAAEEEQETVPQETDEDGQTQPPVLLPGTPVVTAADKLQLALDIQQQLEANGIIGDVASVDVTNTTEIELWYGKYYQVKLGDGSRLNYKIASMKAAIGQMGQYQSGILDVSFTIWPDEVGYTPF